MISDEVPDFHALSDQTVQDMLKDKQLNPDLIISYSFLEYYNHTEIEELIRSVYEYAKILTSLNSAYISLKQDGKILQAQTLAEKQSKALPDSFKRVALKYGKVLLKYKTLVSPLEDPTFFETIIHFIARVVKTCFPHEQSRVIEDELNRLFRSTAFNIAHRKNIEAEASVKFPQIKTSPKKDSESVMKNIMARHLVNRESTKSRFGDIIKGPSYSRLSPFKAISSRSPLISMILPSPKDKIREFEEYRRKLITKSQRLPRLIN